MCNKGIKTMLLGIVVILISILIAVGNTGEITINSLEFYVAIIGVVISVLGFRMKN